MIEIKKRRFTLSDDGMLQFQIRYHAGTEDEALFGVPATFRGMPRRGHNGGEWDAGIGQYVVDASYEGLTSEGEDPANDQYEIQGEFREEAIESHRYRGILEEKYGGYEEDGRLKFPSVWVVPKQGGTGLSNGATTEPNPFFNVTTYPVYFEVATHTYVRKSVSPAVHRRKGTIVTDLPSGFRYGGDAKAWFVDAPSIAAVGNAWRIRETYKEMTDLKHLRLLAVLVDA